MKKLLKNKRSTAMMFRLTAGYIKNTIKLMLFLNHNFSVASSNKT